METEICEAMHSDLGRDMFLNYIAEVAFLEASTKHDARHLKEWMKQQKEEIELMLCPGAAYTKYEPLGVVGVFGSWNAPFVTTLKPLIQAITAGNCVIIKPSEHSPKSSAVMKKFTETYLDKDYIVCIEGAVDVAVAINQLPLDLICFTGSTMVGKLIAQTAAKNLTPCILELGGKCPLIVDHNAQMDFSSAKIAFGKTINSGQICIAPDYVFVHESRIKEFIESVQLRFKEMYGEKPDGSELQGKMINDFHTDRVAKLIDGAGGTLICGGKVNKKVRHIEPTIILEPDLNSQLMREEIFGPVLPVFPFKDIGQVIKFINDRDKPLAVYYFGNANGDNAADVCNKTSSGAFVCNEVITHINSNYMGFGGVGMSGTGRHGGYDGFKCFSNKKGILLKNPAPESMTKLLMPPFGPKMEKFLRGWAVTLLLTNMSYVMWWIKCIVVGIIGIAIKAYFF